MVEQATTIACKYLNADAPQQILLFLFGILFLHILMGPLLALA